MLLINYFFKQIFSTNKQVLHPCHVIQSFDNNEHITEKNVMSEIHLHTDQKTAACCTNSLTHSVIRFRVKFLTQYAIHTLMILFHKPPNIAHSSHNIEHTHLHPTTFLKQTLQTLPPTFPTETPSPQNI